MKYLIIGISTLAIIGCAAKEIAPGSEKIMLTSHAAPSHCEFIGEVSGSQGNIMTSDFTSDENLIKGARNEMRNKAFELGANFVVIENQSQSQNTSGSGGAYNATIIGNAFICPRI